MLRRLLSTNAPASTVLVWLSVGSVFLSEGIQKFLYPIELAAGRFAKIGIPAPEIMGPFVGGCEIFCGALLIIGLLTRLAAIVLLIDISVAIVSTKIPVLLGHGFWGLSLSKLPRYGFWSMMHEAGTEVPSVRQRGEASGNQESDVIERILNVPAWTVFYRRI
jgi:putative oxidoreductase